jgi:nicotinamidase-related amidase
MSEKFIHPTLFSSQDAYKPAYAARIEEFIEAGRQTDLPPASGDQEKIAVILVDYQHDFVNPSGALYVPGSQEDIERFLIWFYKNADRITSIYASMDTHLPYHIFYDAWWKNPRTGEHPHPFTEITEEDVMKEIWVPSFQSELDWSLHYVRLLKQQAKKNLMIWPYHTLEGTLGHMLCAPISEAIAWHSAARNTQPEYIAKGRTRRTEYYGIFGAEIPDPDDPDSDLNIEVLEALMEHDKVYVAGEAKSHCVLESEKQLVHYFGNRQQLVNKVHFLIDCTTSIKTPTFDFEEQTEKELAEMQKMGVKMVRSSDPLD